MKRKGLWIAAIIIILLAGLAGGAYYIYDDVVNVDTIYQGIYIEEYDVSGMTKDEAREHVKKEKLQELQDKSMDLKYNDFEYKLSLEDLGFEYDFDEAAKWAFTKGRTGGGPVSRYREIKNLETENWEIPLKFDYSEDKISSEVDNIADDIDKEAIDSILSFNNGNFSASQEELGVSVKKEELISKIRENIEDLNDINIPVEEVEPKYTQEYYGKINGVLGEYSTSFKGSSSGRRENIRISAQSFNNLVVHPGQEVSYNEITGPKSSAYGYKEAPVILEGELVPGLGGGVCQTSTTLYNTLLFADLTITERSPHSLPPAYVNLGRDAAVASGSLDLKFRNDFEYPIYMASKVIGDRVYFYVYGDAKARDYKVSVTEETVDYRPYTTKKILDESMEPGTMEIVQQGRNGYKSQTYKSIIKDGKVVSSKQINSDYYREREHIVKHGPEKVEPEPEAEVGEELEAEGEAEAEPVQEPAPVPEVNSADPIEANPEI